MGSEKLQSLAASMAENLLSSSAGPLVRLLAHRARVRKLEFEVLYAFLVAAFRWVAADEDYCRVYCLPDRSSENERRTAAAADAKHAARENLEAEFRQFGLHSWSHSDAVDARRRVRQLLKHARSTEPELSGISVNTPKRRPRRSFASPSSSPAASSVTPRSPARPSSSASQRQHTPIRKFAPSNGSSEESEVQLLKRQVRQLELRLRDLEQDNERLSARVGELSSLDDSASVPADRGAIKQLVEEAVSVATQRLDASGASWDHGMTQNTSDTGGGMATTETLGGRDSARLHWAATRIQAVHRGKINRSIGDE
jgi:hypothetical protein